MQKYSSDVDQHLYQITMSEVERFLFDLFFLGYVEDSSSGLSFTMPSELSWACYCEVRSMHACTFWCHFNAMQLADRNVHGYALNHYSIVCCFCVWHIYRSHQEKTIIQMCHVGILLRNCLYLNLWALSFTSKMSTSKYRKFSNFWCAFGAPILFSDLGFCMASCLYVYIYMWADLRKGTIWGYVNVLVRG